MPILRAFLAAFILLALASPAPAQSNFDGASRGGVGRGNMGGGGGFRGGPGGGLGLVPGLLLPAIAAGARAAAQQGDDEPPPRHRRPRPPHKKVPPPRLVHQSAPETPIHPRRRQEAPRAKTASTRAFLPPPAGETRFLPNEVLVVFLGGASEKQIAALARRRKLERVQTRELTLIGVRVHRFRFAGDRTVPSVIAELAKEPNAALAEPHYLFALQGEAAKPDALPGKSAEPAPASSADALLHLSEAHKIATGRGVRIAVIDSLIDASHAEIEGSVAARFDALDEANAQPQGHGTGMASAIAGHRQIEGAAPEARILAARAFDGTGAPAVALNILAGIDWAAAQKAQIINMSFAGPHDPLLSQMLAAADGKKIILIAAAGNEGPQSHFLYPAADPHVVAVSAVDAQEQVYAMASRVPYVAVFAPGVDILVAAPRGAYDLSTGTSVACAEISGIAALLLEKRPGLDGAALRSLLRASARALPGASGVGPGVADAQAAVERKD